MGMVDDTKGLFYGDKTSTQVASGANLRFKAFTFGGGWSFVLKDGSIITSQDLIKWRDKSFDLEPGKKLKLEIEYFFLE
ncbi:MAG: hypothetical protein RR816_12935, partial [Clostridia bacterium]